MIKVCKCDNLFFNANSDYRLQRILNYFQYQNEGMHYLYQLQLLNNFLTFTYISSRVS